MRKPTAFLAAILVVLFGWLFFRNFQIEGLKSVRLLPRSQPTEDASRAEVESVLHERTFDTLRIGSFNIQDFDQSKAAKPHIMEMLARVGKQFDVLAIQEVRSASPDIIPKLVSLMNQDGSEFDFVVGPRVGPENQTEQYAFVYDRDRLIMDRENLYSVQDPGDLFRHDPLVGWFRTRGPNLGEAFTFSLVNVRVDAHNCEAELDLLDNVLFSVRDDGRGEDDIILLGDFHSNEQNLGQLGQISGLRAAIAGLPTDTRYSAHFDNILFEVAATQEFNGMSGVFDFMRKFNLSLDEALEVSDHLPVWAEFTLLEGGYPGRVAVRPTRH